MQKDLITKNGYEKIVEEFKRLLKEKSYWVKEKEIAAQLGEVKMLNTLLQKSRYEMQIKD